MKTKKAHPGVHPNKKRRRRRKSTDTSIP